MPYLIDSSAFIQAKNMFYRFSFCPGFWDWIAAEHGKGTLFSVEKIKDELEDGNDQLATWAKQVIPGSFFISPSANVVTTQAVVAQWVNAQAYSASEKSKFLSKADPWLIAEAIQGKYEIITFEDLVPVDSSKVKIPNVANNFGVNTVSLYDILEATGCLLSL